ncbi:MAG: N-acetyl-gamma-glutamyl-phosphate reductase [Methanobacteriota archaeon]
MSHLRVAVYGATGYLGGELTRLLLSHPDAEIVALASESHAGEPAAARLPQLAGLLDEPLVSISDAAERAADVAFLALPHGVSAEVAGSIGRNAPTTAIIDLSADFRLRDVATYERWYGKTHPAPGLVPGFAYGLPEFFADDVRSARRVANPGCYPTGAALAMGPLLAAGHRFRTIVIDAKSGVSGAGKAPSEGTHFAETNESLKAYGLLTHRHTPEIEQTLGRLSGAPGGTGPRVVFTPHLLPVNRGILTAAYLIPEDGARPSDSADLLSLYEKSYAEAPFVRLRTGSPELKHVRGTNFCDVSVQADPRTGTVLALSAIDNLVKGGSGQAIQNMNLMFGLPETRGLWTGGLSP